MSDVCVFEDAMHNSPGLRCDALQIITMCMWPLLLTTHSRLSYAAGLNQESGHAHSFVYQPNVNICQGYSICLMYKNKAFILHSSTTDSPLLDKSTNESIWPLGHCAADKVGHTSVTVVWPQMFHAFISPLCHVPSIGDFTDCMGFPLLICQIW